jgi:ABC-type Fe3+/spermidine/putrescine transport system ATPase subunit
MDDALRLDALRFAYGSTPVLREITFAVPQGQFFTLLGPSGCGKSTLLKLLGGYLTPDAGEIWLKDRKATNALPESRNIGMVFQNYALFPHLSAWKNVAFGLEVRRLPRAEISQRVEAMLHRVRLNSEEWHRRPAELSGGQQQRVALARALVFRPSVLLLDEPLTNLDRQLREQLREELRILHRESETTTILVTHDREEALTLSDRVAVLNAGRIVQIGTPQELYRQPRTPFVARFLGEANLFEGAQLGHPVGSLVLVRPEAISLSGSRTGRVIAVGYRGNETMLELESDGLPWKIRCGNCEVAQVGDMLSFDVRPEQCWRIPERDAV